MVLRTIVVTGLRILAVCAMFAVCFIAGGALPGIDKIGQQAAVSQPASPSSQAAQMPEDFLFNFVIFSLCVGGTLSYLILRSRWHGWMLAGTIFGGMYGIGTVASQVESIAFLSNKLPHGMIRAIFVQGAIAAALFAPLAVLVLGKWRAASVRAPDSLAIPLKFGSILLRLAFLVAAFVFLYMLFGYYIAWKNPELQRYYGGPELATFWTALKHNWTNSPWIYVLASFRALLNIVCLYAVIRMLHASRQESALAASLFLTCWTTVLLLPNPLMPASVARSHFWETLGFSLVFGALAGWLLHFSVSARAIEGKQSTTKS